jgi:hypothetical protein
MTTATVANFLIEGLVENLAGKALHSEQRHNPARHRVRITNLSTLPYDVELDQALPDPNRPFSYVGATPAAWNVVWGSVTSPPPVEDAHDLSLHGPAATNARLWTQTFRYRLATGAAVGIGGLYQTVSGHPLPVDVRLTVT